MNMQKRAKLIAMKVAKMNPTQASVYIESALREAAQSGVQGVEMYDKMRGKNVDIHCIDGTTYNGKTIKTFVDMPHDTFMVFEHSGSNVGVLISQIKGLVLN